MKILGKVQGVDVPDEGSSAHINLKLHECASACRTAGVCVSLPTVPCTPSQAGMQTSFRRRFPEGTGDCLKTVVLLEICFQRCASSCRKQSEHWTPSRVPFSF